MSKSVIVSEIELWMNESFTTYACNSRTGNRLEVNHKGCFRITAGHSKHDPFFVSDATVAVRVYNALEKEAGGY